MTTVSFADLTHTGVGINANNNPLAVGYIAAYAKAHLGDAIDARLFKYPAALSRFLAHETPTIACFTNYMWNEALSCAFARLHQAAPSAHGGRDGRAELPDRRQRTEGLPRCDTPRSISSSTAKGRSPFVGLFEALSEIDFDAERFKRDGRRVPGVHYVIGDAMVGGDPAPRILDLSRIPSPYTTGLLDEFFDDKLTPMVQTTRGCPYACTFCHDGIAYMNPTRAFSPERVFEELAYVEARVKTPTLQLADLNWGMFKADLQTATWLAESRRRSGWPRNIMVATAKNQKERIVEMSRVLGDALQVGASVQSTDPEVLQNIKRTNISLDAIVKMAKGATDSHTGSFTEIILGLPGDTSEKHIRSVFDMVDAGIQDLRLFQFILLPGTEGSDLASRATVSVPHRIPRAGPLLRALPGRRRGGLGRRDPGNLSRQQHDAERRLLRVPVVRSDDCHLQQRRHPERVLPHGGGARRKAIGGAAAHFADGGERRPEPAGVYDEFKEAEAKNFFATREELDTFLARPGAIDDYLRGEYGVNHIYKARTTALMTLFSVLARIAHEAVTIELREHGFLDPLLSLYFDELLEVTIARKSQLNDLNCSTDLTLHFDFYALHGEDYLLDPRRVYVPNGIRFTVRHTEAQQADLRKYFAQYGEGVDGIGQFLQRNDSHLSAVLYRTLEYAHPNPIAAIARLVPPVATAS